ncbi:heme exporter protein CcmD [Magnetospira sp. QH-2]|uniref:heme exporter protein CcmD n=1 Tax=Magnetospira sp. (strain QH-2) TaxID=1288970 RepID=UPI0003E8153E
MQSIMEWAEMGGYASFIWPCYILATVVLVAVLIQSLKAARDQETTLDSLKQAVRGQPQGETEREA